VLVANTDNGPSPVNVVLFADGDAFERFGRVLSHLTVGLVDQAIHLRVVSADLRVSTLSLGPVRPMVRPQVRWPFARRRLTSIVEMLSSPAPTIIHALSAESFDVAADVADACEADLVFQISSLADCEALEDFDLGAIGCFMIGSGSLVSRLEREHAATSDRMVLVRPGILASERPAGFARADRAVTLLCTSALERHSGVDLFIEAIFLLRQRGRSVVGFILGQGRQEWALREMVRARNLSACVSFARPLCDFSEVLLGADVFVRPSSDTAFFVDTLAAMAAGLVVVTFPSPAVDFLRDQETCLVSPRMTADSLADAIEQLMDQRERAREIAVKAVQYVRSHHGVSMMAERVATAYRKLTLPRTTFSLRE